MADVDLIPADYARRVRLRRRMKPLVAALLAIALVIGLARVALYVLMSAESGHIAQLEKDSQIAAQAKAEADSLRQQRALAEKQLAELDELRGRDRLKLLLHAIDGAYSDSVWLDTLRFVPRDIPAADTTPLPGGGRSGIIVVPKGNAAVPAGAPSGGAQRAEITGRATNHTKLAQFMRSLAAQPGVSEVRLVDTGLGSHANTPVIDLTLVLLIDDKARGPR
jgi:Tfp pilus assembly protein PilN